MGSLLSRALIVGAGIIGTAVAEELTRQDMEVTLISDRGIGGGATAAGMGHLVALDGEDSKTNLTTLSLSLWEQITLPADCEHDRCGTVWVAETDEELSKASAMQKRFRARGVHSEILSSSEIADLEPELRAGLAGGLVVKSDSVIYPPNAAKHFWNQAQSRGAQLLAAQVTKTSPHAVELHDGTVLEADWVVVAAGDRTPFLLPQLPIRPRKGHLLITARAERFINHQVVELGYGKTTESRDAVAVACNVQPRPTGQVLIGSSRQEETRDPSIEPEILCRMLDRALAFLPRLPQLTALRAWTGFRAATDDGAPIIGVLEPGLAVASGHEGLGITLAPGTARLLGELLSQGDCSIEPGPFDPHRSLGSAA